MKTKLAAMKRYRPITFLARLLIWVLPVALVSSSAAAQSRVPTHVACVGDSITYGYMASSSSASYPSVLQNMFGTSVHVGNFGVNSATMLSTGNLPYKNQSQYTAATTFVSGAGATAVVDVIIMLGTNDSKPSNWMTSAGTQAQQFVTDCTAMVDHFASLPTHPLVYLALPPRAFSNGYTIDGTILHDQIIPLIKEVAASKGLPVIDVDTPTASHPELFPDGVHPNDKGYVLVAQVMHDGLLAAAGTSGGGHDGQAGQGGASGAAAGGRGAGGGQAAGTGGGAAGAAGNPANGGSGGERASGGTAGTGAGGASSNGGRAGAGPGGVNGAAGTSATATGGVGGTSGALGTSTGGTVGVGGSPGANGSSGCSCRLMGDNHDNAGTVALLMIGVSFLRRRRRMRRRSTSRAVSESATATAAATSGAGRNPDMQGRPRSGGQNPRNNL